jgi:predicted O-methyltransferase YrrM
MNLAGTALTCGPRAIQLSRHAIRNLRALQRTTELSRAVALVRERRPATVVEIGSYRGGTLYCWARVSTPDARLVSIDLAVGEQMEKYGYGAGDPHGLRNLVLPTQDLHVILGDSHSAEVRDQLIAALGVRPIDFLFIDGDHTYAGVKSDYETYAPLVRPQGLIGFHDIVPNSGMPDLEVWKFWNELKSSGRSWRECIDAGGGTGMGIGFVVAM